MKKLILIISFLFFGSLFAQNQIYIQYMNVRSPVANVYEDLYTNGTKVISKQDGNIMWTDPSFNKNKKTQDFYFISTIDKTTNDRDFFFTSFVRDNAEDYYFVYDKVPDLKWKMEN